MTEKTSEELLEELVRLQEKQLHKQDAELAELRGESKINQTFNSKANTIITMEAKSARAETLSKSMRDSIEASIDVRLPDEVQTYEEMVKFIASGAKKKADWQPKIY